MTTNDVTPSSLSTYTPQEDTSELIRTYAKDVAMLTKTPQPIPTAKPKAKQAEDGVTLSSFDPSPVDHRNDPASPREFAQEKVDITAADSAGVFGSNTLQPTQIPVMENVMPEVPKVDEEREAILARLRAKLKSHAPETPVAAETLLVQSAPSPTPEGALTSQIQDQPQEPILRTAAPNFERTPEPVVPLPPLPERPQPEPVRETVRDEASPLHTFSSDFANRIDTEGATTFSVLATQADAGKAGPTPKPARRILPLVAGVAMVLIGIGAITSAYILTHNKPQIPTVANVPSLIAFDESVEVKGTGQDLMQAVANVAQGASVSGNVIVTYLTTASSTAQSGSTPEPGGALIRNLPLNAPDILLRNIDDSSTVGTINAGGQSAPFMILKVSSYERTFAGMLAWEATMPNDLALFYPINTTIPSASSTATSTIPRLSSSNTPVFTDAVVDNYDVRILRDINGQSRILYGYKGKGTLIIAHDEAAFRALVARLSAQGL